MQRFDTIVVGAGAAGLVAGFRAAECGQKTLLLEKNARAGTKILMSGGTRCNLTHATDRKGIVDAFGEQGPFLHSALAAFSPQDTIQTIESQGVKTKIEPGGKVFPVSNQAADVLRALLQRLDQSGCTLALSEPVIALRAEKTNAPDGGFCIQTPHRQLLTDRVILTTGGQSYPGCGTTGDGYRWLRAMGHTLVPPRPALTPITTDEPWIHQLKGLTIPDVQLRILQDLEPGASPTCQATDAVPPSPARRRANSQRRRRTPPWLDERRGSFLFTHFGMSGPVALDISRTIARHPLPDSLSLLCDFAPQVDSTTLDRQIRAAWATHGKKQVVHPLSQCVPRRLAECLLEALAIDPQLRAAEVNKHARQSIVQRIKGWPVRVRGTRGFRKAEVTAGGVVRDEVDSRTMASRIVPGLYIAGELLDLDGPIGGYNFQAAFSTGYLAGQSQSNP